jgi:hypothetical protein
MFIQSIMSNRSLLFTSCSVHFYFAFMLLVLLGISAAHVQAAIPAAAVTDPLFAKGYLNVSHYGVLPSASATTNTAGINQALIDAYNRNDNTALGGGGTLTGSLSLYFPSGTYMVNDTLQAHTITGTPTAINYKFDTPKNSISMVGSTTGTRPKLKLVTSASGFGNVNSPKYLLEFKNWKIDTATGNMYIDPNTGLPVESAGQGYYQMLRDIDLDCGGNSGCIALYFNNSQNSSIENVSINANGAHTGIRGGSGPAGGMVNIVVTGGNIGIDTSAYTSSGAGALPGIVIAGVKLARQVEHSIIHNGFAPLTVVGFEIITDDNATRAALTLQNGYNEANFAAINLIDGMIRLGGEPTVAAIDNTEGKNFYARNGYVTPSGSFSGNSVNGKLIKSAGNTTITGNGTRKLVAEYNYTMPGADPKGQLSQNLINGVVDSNEYAGITNSAPVPPSDIVTRHAWVRLPSMEDSNAYDVRSGGINPGTSWAPTIVSHTTLQGIIDANQKVFLPKGIYQLTGPITLRSDTILFGAGRGLTRIEVDPNWSSAVTAETPIIQTDNSTTATTYLGDLSIGVDATNLANDFFTALHWKAGASSMVHMGTVYRSPGTTSPANRWTTNAHSLLKITDNGGGRWYFPGSFKNFTSEDSDFRILKVGYTTQPLWIYSLNAEHSRNTDTYMEFNHAENVRVYGIKSEYSDDVSYKDLSNVLKIRNSSNNVGIFGHGALRNGLTNKGAIEFLYSDNVLATLIAPSKDDLPGPGVTGAMTVKESIVGGNFNIAYPEVVTLFKRGTLNDAVMVHTAPSY